MTLALLQGFEQQGPVRMGHTGLFAALASVASVRTGSRAGPADANWDLSGQDRQSVERHITITRVPTRTRS